MKSKRRPIYRGDIFYVQPVTVSGHEQKGRRPGIILSNANANKYSPVVTIVYLTMQEKGRHLPVHVPIFSAPRPSIALCEQLDSVDIKRLQTYMGQVTDKEMTAIETALCIQLSLPDKQTRTIKQQLLLQQCLKENQALKTRLQTLEQTNSNPLQLYQYQAKYQEETNPLMIKHPCGLSLAHTTQEAHTLVQKHLTSQYKKEVQEIEIKNLNTQQTSGWIIPLTLEPIAWNSDDKQIVSDIKQQTIHLS